MNRQRLRFILVRMVLSLISLFVVATLLFVIFRAIPGNPSTNFISPGLTEESREIIAGRYGFDQPLHVQYLLYMEGLLVGDLGISISLNEPVIEVLFERTLNTLVLILGAIIVSFIIGPIIGAYFAWKRGSRFERYGTIAVLSLYAAPVFWTGMLGIMLFSFTLGWLPSGGMSSIGATPVTLQERFLTLDFLRHLILPFTVTALYFLSFPTLIMRNTMIDVLGSEFIEMNRAQGLPERRILYKHAARNSLLPVLHYAAIAIGFSFGGSVVIETVFSWPGVGRLLWNAVSSQDYPLAQGGFLMIATMIIALNFVVDIISVYVDPRAVTENQNGGG